MRQRVAFVLFALVVCLLVPTPGVAAPCSDNVVVTSPADSGPGTLRDALLAVCAGGDVFFALSYPASIVLTGGDLAISRPVQIHGPGPDQLTLDAHDVGRGFYIAADDVIIGGLTVRNGGGDVRRGGAIFNAGSHVVLNDVVLTHSGSNVGGALHNQGAMIVRQSRLSQNQALRGGAIGNWGVLILDGAVLLGNGALGDGGAVYNRGVLAIVDSLLANNAAGGTMEGANGRGGGLFNEGAAAVRGSHFSGNAAEHGGAISSDGGSLLVAGSTFDGNLALAGGAAIHGINGSTLTVVNTRIENNTAAGRAALSLGSSVGVLRRVTIAGNEAPQGVIGHVGPGPSSLLIEESVVAGNQSDGYLVLSNGLETETTIRNSTFSGNSVAGGDLLQTNTGGALIVEFSTLALNPAAVLVGALDGTVQLQGNILAPADGVGCAGGGIVSLGHNLITDASCPGDGPGDLPETEPLLGPLADNGGPTPTHEPLPGSLAIDAGPATCVARDQRGVPRPRGPACDVGAVEVWP